MIITKCCASVNATDHFKQFSFTNDVDFLCKLVFINVIRVERMPT